MHICYLKYKKKYSSKWVRSIFVDVIPNSDRIITSTIAGYIENENN